MKKNLAKRIVLGLLTGAVLMSSSVAWASVGVYQTESSSGGVYEGSLTVGDKDTNKGADVQYATVVGIGAYTGGNASNSVVLGYGSTAQQSLVVSVGAGDDASETGGPATRYIINVSDVPYTNDTCGSYAVNVNTLNDALSEYYTKDEVNDKIDAISDVGGNSGNYVETEVDESGSKKTEIGNLSVQESASGTVTLSAGTGENTSAVVTFEQDKVVFGKNSSWYQEAEGFFAGGDANHTVSSAKAALKEDGSLMGASGKFIVDGANGNVTAQDVTAANFVTSSGTNIGAKLGELDAQVQTNTTTIATKADKTYVDTELGKKANQSDLNAEIDAREQADQNLQTQIDNIGGGAIAGLNQRLEKTNAKINKVGAGAAALAALHPLDYDPDDKLTFSAGMGNYAGENAAALGAFYRPNEKFMLSLGGTMGNGENMVNLGLSIGLDKPNGFAKLSKRELIQKVNVMEAKYEAVEAENEAMKDQLANADERIAKLEALVAQLVAK